MSSIIRINPSLEDVNHLLQKEADRANYRCSARLAKLELSGKDYDAPQGMRWNGGEAIGKAYLKLKRGGPTCSVVWVVWVTGKISGNRYVWIGGHRTKAGKIMRGINGLTNRKTMIVASRGRPDEYVRTVLEDGTIRHLSAFIGVPYYSEENVAIARDYMIDEGLLAQDKAINLR